jgi:hypothetical protein
MDYWFKAAAGKLEPFALVLEGPFRMKGSKRRAIGSHGDRS